MPLMHEPVFSPHVWWSQCLKHQQMSCAFFFHRAVASQNASPFIFPLLFPSIHHLFSPLHLSRCRLWCVLTSAEGLGYLVATRNLFSVWWSGSVVSAETFTQQSGSAAFDIIFSVSSLYIQFFLLFVCIWLNRKGTFSHFEVAKLLFLLMQLSCVINRCFGSYNKWLLSSTVVTS